MTDLLLPAGIIAASLAMTYFCCVRPMRRGHCAGQGLQHSADNELDRALRQARADLEKIRAEVPNDVPTPSDRSMTANEPSACCSDPRTDQVTAPTEL